jgi:pyrroloquinoline quinone biosynthesis protein D
VIAEEARPRLPRGVRLREDKARERWVLLAPERIVKVNPIAVEILKLCDGSRTLGEIVGGLAARFNADPARVGADVRALLTSLSEKRMAEL